MELKDLTGKKFGNLTVLYRDMNPKYNRPYWVCLCDCGNIISVRGSHLVSDSTKSCGCLKHRCKHGDSVGKQRTRLFGIYHNMVSRCIYPSTTEYHCYGGRGIRVCDEWLSSYESFKKWAIENGYNDDLTIDRINPDGNYEPSNCRWATVTEQQNNRRYNVRITLQGKTQTTMQWSRELGINYHTIIGRYNRGLPPEDILRKVVRP